MEETELNETKQNNEDSEEITDEIITKSFIFYPNPTNGPVNIEIEGDIDQLFLTDQNGRILERIDTKGKQTLNINIERYADGMYYLNYISADQSFSGKLLLIHI